MTSDKKVKSLHPSVFVTLHGFVAWLRSSVVHRRFMYFECKNNKTLYTFSWLGCLTNAHRGKIRNVTEVRLGKSPGELAFRHFKEKNSVCIRLSVDITTPRQIRSYIWKCKIQSTRQKKCPKSPLTRLKRATFPLKYNSLGDVYVKTYHIQICDSNILFPCVPVSITLKLWL